MNIQYCSDLHLEFRENLKYINSNPIPPLGEVLILAGDITLFSRMKAHDSFFNYISDNFPLTYWIAGNHEYYDSDINRRSGTVMEKIRDNILLVNNQSFVHGSTRLIFSTLWSHVSKPNRRRVENSISDFNAILLNGKRFTADDFNVLHDNDLAFIRTELETPWDGITIVATHHVPTFMNYPKKYKGDPINEVFASEQTDLIIKTSPTHWIYGHNHSNTPPFNIGLTQLITNQLGYVHHHEHGSFDSSRHIII
ncbi:MAG TPA: metallophosphoesterase [Chitinophagaceae bacterium]|nr:metallophosphoesterase [Chitinophagaceae bacterium]